MAFHLGFREVILDLANIIQWKAITIDTGASQSTLQDIKVPEYGGCYMYKNNSLNTQNRYIFWRVCHDIVELWEESLDINFINNHVQLKFADTPVLEGLTIHETNQHIIILLATVSSVHRFRLPHPLANSSDSASTSVFSELSYHSLREYHNHHLLNNDVSGEGLPHTACTHLVDNCVGKGDALFILGQNGGSILLVSMTCLPYSVHVSAIKTTSLINRFFTGFVPNIFRGVEGSETVSSLVMEEFKDDIIVFGVCFDGRLRAWSCSKMECILVHNSLENTGEAGRKLVPGAQRHLVRSYSCDDKVYLSVFLSFAELQLIIIFQPVLLLGQLSMNLVKTLYPPRHDLVDLTITGSYIWSLWTDINNDAKLLYSPVNSEGGPMNTPGFKDAILEPFPEKEIPLTDPSIDPSEIYLAELLAPNRFSAYTLQKALGIYRRNSEVTRTDNSGSGCSFSGLWKMADDIEAALKDAIDQQISTDMSEEEVAEIKLNAWSTFYSHTLQYHQVAKKAVSIVKVGGDGLVAVMRKQSISWMRPLDALELLTLGSLNANCIPALASTPFLNEDPSIAVAAVALARPLRSINNILDPEVAVAFCLDLHHLEPPDQVASSIAISLLSGGEEVEFDEPLSRVITNQLSGVSGIIPGLQAYLKALTLDLGNPDALTLDSSSSSSSSQSTSPPSWLSGALSSKLGSSLLAATVSQLAEHRLQLCRDLLLLQHILLQFNILSPENKNRVHTTLIPQTTLLTQAYFALNKVCTTPASIPSPSNLETSRRQLAALALSDSMPLNPTVFSDFPSTTLELFIRSSGGIHARTLVISILEEERNETTWSQILMPLATTVAQLAWPISKCLALVEFLVWGNQHTAVQEYIRLLQTWCEWNSCSRKFLLGISLLNEGEARKAMNLLLSATEGVSSEEYLGRKISGGGPDTPLEEAQVQYCLKIIRLLEQSGHISLALEVAKAGIDLAPLEDPGLAALYSVSFKYHLELEHHDEAFTALMACPDQHRRRNCLRQLIITLYERKCLSTLVGYNYGILESEVITILENRARSADILVTNYYDLLFAFHISKHNFKKGAWVMYECALRLNKEGLGEQGLQQQAKCYLTCINCLQHVPPDQAWIIKPLGRSHRDEGNDVNMSEAEDDGGGSEGRLRRLMRLKKKPQMQVLELADLEREYQLVHARLKLFKVHTPSSIQLPGGPMNTHDTISLLIHAKLFRDALKLTRLFALPFEPIFEGLALACIEADISDDKSQNWHWLAENGILRDTCEGAGWWSLLKNLLEEEETGQHSYLHKTVTSALLLKGHSLPAWLCDSYKKRNCAELIRLYLQEGLLEDATRLAINFIDALLGVGTQQMGLPNALHAAAPSVWVPYTVLDHLILELKEVQSRSQFNTIYETLMQKIDKYHTELQRVTRDRIMVLQAVRSQLTFSCISNQLFFVIESNAGWSSAITKIVCNDFYLKILKNSHAAKYKKFRILQPRWSVDLEHCEITHRHLDLVSGG